MSNNNCCTNDLLSAPHRKYKLCEKIGSGAYGEVYKGTRDDDGLSVALKRIMITDKDGFNDIPLSTHRELNVLRRLNKIGNDNIVRLLDVVLKQIGVRLCLDLVFELVEYDLEMYLKQYNIGGDMSISKILNLGQQLMDGVHFMHSHRVLHRDLKPANILINHEGTDLKITDFGLARILGFDAALTPIAVTLWYRSPEILFKNSYLTACDVWSVGCIIGEMVYGRPLFAAEDEVKQLGKIVCRLGYEAVHHWPDDAFFDSTGFLNEIDPARSLDRVLKRADINLRTLIKELLRFDPELRMLSTDALARLTELRQISSVNGCTCHNLSVNGGRVCALPECVLESSEDFMVVNSVVRNVLDDDDDDDEDDVAEEDELCVPGVMDCNSIQHYPHEEVEVSLTDDLDGDDDSSIDSVVTDDDGTVPKESDEVGDSFSSYRSQNNESFSSYAPSSQTGVESTDEDICEANELAGLDEFNDGFIISGDSDTCQAVEAPSTEHSDDTPRTGDHVSVKHESPQSVALNISPFQIAITDAHTDTHQPNSAVPQRPAVLAEVNITVPVSQPQSQKHTPITTRKRIISSDLSEDGYSASEVENASPCPVRPTVARHKSLRRRLSVVGPHVAIDRRQSVLVASPAIVEHEEMGNTSFGEHSLSRALDSVVGGAANSPHRLTDRPKVIVRRRSQFK